VGGGDDGVDGPHGRLISPQGSAWGRFGICLVVFILFCGRKYTIILFAFVVAPL
jgi:hypothetical protein